MEIPFLSPIPKDNVPREKLPMVDPTWFKTRTNIPRQPKALLPVPHAGLKSLYAESFQQPTDVKAKENYYCAVDTPFVLPGNIYIIDINKCLIEIKLDCFHLFWIFWREIKNTDLDLPRMKECASFFPSFVCFVSLDTYVIFWLHVYIAFKWFKEHHL